MSTSRVLTLVLLQLLVNIIFGIGGSGEADLKTRSISLSANNVAVLDGATIPWPTTIGAPDEDGHPINVPVRTTGESMLPAATQFSDDRIVLAVRELIMTVNELVTASCVGDLNRTFAALERREAWAITMFDASAKLPSGIENGAVYQFGNFDECMSTVAEPLAVQQPHQQSDVIISSRDGSTTSLSPSASIVIESQYCLAKVHAVGYTVRKAANRHFQPHNHTATTLHWGVCLPASCSAADTAHLLAAVTGHSDVRVDARRCTRPANANTTRYTTLDILVACVICAMLSMVVFCSAFHVVLWLCCSSSKQASDDTSSAASGMWRLRSRRSRGLVEQIIMSFSMFENIQKLGQASRDELGLSSLNGIKALAMMCIIASHAMLFMVGGPQLNTDYYAHEMLQARNAFLLNSPLLVDTFLLLSGFLFAHLVLVELENRGGRVNFGLLYVFRYVRLTPAYLAVIAVYTTWLPRLGSGPMWSERMTREQDRCKESWWLNVLYVNNYVGTESICMFQSWYLAADTQLFVLAPLIVYPLWRWRRWGLSALVALLTVSVLVPMLVTVVYDTDASLLPYANEVEDISTNTFFVNWYIKTHMRATSYLFGILAGYLVHYVRENGIKLGRRLVWSLWLVSAAAAVASMCSIIHYVEVSPTEQPASLVSRALFAGLHRLGWGAATAWMVLACALGHAGPLRAVLAARALVPLSRLTYCAYLMNGMVELYQAASVRSPKYMSTINMLGETSAHVMLTFIGALILCLLFESPIHGLEKILLRRATVGGSNHMRKEQPQLCDVASGSSGSSICGSLGLSTAESNDS